MLSYMQLTVVVDGHNCVATATAGNAHSHSQDFTLVATEAERGSIFSQKSWWPFLAIVCKTLLYWIKQAVRPNKASFFREKIPSINRWGHGFPDPSLATPLATQRNATRCVCCHTATQCVCERCPSVSPLNYPSKNRPPLLTIWLLPWETQVSKHASVFMLQPALPPTIDYKQLVTHTHYEHQICNATSVFAHHSLADLRFKKPKNSHKSSIT